MAIIYISFLAVINWVHLPCSSVTLKPKHTPNDKKWLPQGLSSRCFQIHKQFKLMYSVWHKCLFKKIFKLIIYCIYNRKYVLSFDSRYTLEYISSHGRKQKCVLYDFFYVYSIIKYINISLYTEISYCSIAYWDGCVLRDQISIYRR